MLSHLAVKSIRERGVRLAQGMLPRGSSKCAFLLVMLSYQIAFTSVSGDMIALLYRAHFSLSGFEARALPAGSPLYLLVRAVVLGPILESSLLIIVIEVLRRLWANRAIQIVVPAVLMSASHSLDYPLLGLLVVPGFFSDVITYVYWRRESLWSGATMMILLHMLYNASVVLYIVSRRN